MNRESVKQLLSTEYAGLLSLLRRKARDPQIAADLLSDALVVTLNKFDSGQIADPSHIGGYVFQVALNLLRNYRRSFAENPYKRAELNEETLADVPGSESTEQEWGERVRALIQELPSSRDRQLLKRFYLDEEEKETICKELGISPLMFDKIIFRARKRARVLFESKGLRKGDFLCLMLGAMLLVA